MNDYLVRCGKTLLIVCITLCALGIANSLSKRPKTIYIKTQDPNYVQNIGEIQRRLKAQGFYDGKIDYKWGDKTEKAYCNWCAKRAIEGR